MKEEQKKEEQQKEEQRKEEKQKEKQQKPDNKYDDIINLSRPISKKHLPMSEEARAAQFAPFAALTGFDEVIDETADLERKRMEAEIIREEITDI